MRPRAGQVMLDGAWLGVGIALGFELMELWLRVW